MHLSVTFISFSKGLLWNSESIKMAPPSQLKLKILRSWDRIKIDICSNRGSLHTSFIHLHLSR